MVFEKAMEIIVVREEEDIRDGSNSTNRDSHKKDRNKHVVVDICENSENRMGMYGYCDDVKEKGNISGTSISSVISENVLTKGFLDVSILFNLTYLSDTKDHIDAGDSTDPREASEVGDTSNLRKVIESHDPSNLGEFGEVSNPGDPSDPGDPRDPGDPSDPGYPGDLSDPGDPRDHSDPGDHRDPSDPGDPRDPSDPPDPGDPGYPVEPGDPRDPRDPIDPGDTRDTNDSSDTSDPREAGEAVDLSENMLTAAWQETKEKFNMNDFSYCLVLGLLPTAWDINTDFDLGDDLDSTEDSITAGLCYYFISLPAILLLKEATSELLVRLLANAAL